MLHRDMASITVRVTPRSGRTAVEAGADGVVVRVRAAPEAGKATEEAARALAEALGVPPTRVRLRTRRSLADEDVRRRGALERGSAAPAARAVRPSAGVTSRFA